MARLVVDGVHKIYPALQAGQDDVIALRDVNFVVEDHEFCCLLGHSGCGKTTLLNIMAGFESTTGGQITLDGTPVGPPHWTRTMVFQDYALFPWLTVERNIGFGLEVKGVPETERARIVAEHVKLVGLAGFETRLPHQLSGGMKQRVAIARALAVDPQVALLDEPFAALDAQNRGLLQDELVRISLATKKTMVLITHSIEEAIKLSDRIVVMTKRPGTVKANIVVDIPRPRSEDDPRVIALKKELRALIADEREVELA
ncbi:MAG TPA: ABC transporter ATP-binding protein [Casimicrobium sp.]|jgi:NitT/TauT family transport system ATP-binding protein|nr:ABC transporter ATP-binding protein [Casimicrobium sp.]